MTPNDIEFMKQALNEAESAFAEGEIPIGAVLVKDNKIICRAHNTRERSKNPLHHAEMILLEEAGKIAGDWRLNDTILYVTVEPCPMCLGALLQARVGRLVYGCADPKRLSETPNPNIQYPTSYSFLSVRGFTKLSGNSHTVEITGSVLEKECAELLGEFFKNRRGNPLP